jgi:hypothetical protein
MVQGLKKNLSAMKGVATVFDTWISKSDGLACHVLLRSGWVKTL